MKIYIFFSGFSYAIYKGIIRKGYKVPTPIQRKVNNQDFIYFVV